MLMDVLGQGEPLLDLLYEKQSDTEIPTKRMTITVTIKDYEPKRKKI